MAPCQIEGGCSHPELEGYHTCVVCKVPVHNWCFQLLNKTDDAPPRGFFCGKNGTCLSESAQGTRQPQAHAQGAMGDAECCAVGYKCEVIDGPINSKTSCCGKACHLMCISYQCMMCDEEEEEERQEDLRRHLEREQEQDLEEEEEEEEEEEDAESNKAGKTANQRVNGKAPKNAGKAGPGPVVDVTGDGDKSSATKPNVQGKSPGGSASSTPKATPHNPYAAKANNNGKKAGATAHFPSPGTIQRSAGAVGSAPKSVPVQGTTAKGRLGKGVSVATATRESSRIREAAAAAEEAAGGKSRHLFGEGINKAVKAAVHDAVNGLVGHKDFVKQLSSLVSSKTFESSVTEAAKKVPINKSQLKKVVEESGATANRIIQTALAPEIKQATSGMISAEASMKAGVTAMTIATEKMEAASNDGQEEATRGGRRGKQAKTGRAAASEKADSLVKLSVAERNLLATAISDKLSRDVGHKIMEDVGCKLTEILNAQLCPAISTAMQKAVESIDTKAERRMEGAVDALSKQIKGKLGGKGKRRLGKRAAAPSSSSSSVGSSSDSASSPEAKKKKRRKSSSTKGNRSASSASSMPLANINPNTAVHQYEPAQQMQLQPPIMPPQPTQYQVSYPRNVVAPTPPSTPMTMANPMGFSFGPF